jgi:hypothetical protein
MPPDPTTAEPLDPAVLAEFRQQGSAIIAQERGLSTTCRIKLRRLAKSLAIPNDQIDAAIRALHDSEPEAPPNPEAEKFRKRLRKDLAGKTRAIIGPTIEAQIIAAAARKYSLDETTSRRVLNEVAAEIGLTRITAGDALDSLAVQIEQTVGDATWLSREGWDRLRTAGAKWGIELEVVDELIDQKLAANKEEVYRRRFWTRMTLGAAGGGAALVAVIIVVLVFVRAHQNEELPTEAPGAGPLANVTPVAPAVATAPAWWDVDLSVEMAAGESRLGGLSGASKLMKSASADERAKGYEKLVEAVKSDADKPELLQSASGIASGCLALEPDEAAAARLRTALFSLLPASDAPLPVQAADYDLSHWAAETAVEAMRRAGASEERRRALADALSAALSAPFDPAGELTDLRRTVRVRTTLAAYQQLAAYAPRQPAAVAMLHQELASRAAPILSDEELTKAETNLLAAALPSAGKDWHAYEEAIARSASSPDPLNILRLTDTLSRCTDEELVTALSRLLSLRAGVSPLPPTKAEVVKAIRKALGATSHSAASTAADRWQALRERADTALAAPAPAAGDQYELLRQTVELAHLTTMAMALAQGEAGFASFDAGMLEPPALQRIGAGDPERPATVSGATRPLGASDRRDLERYSSMLGGYARQQPAQRVTALRGLAGVGDAAPDISQDQAENVAKYLLIDKVDAEHAEVVNIVPAIRHWKRLRLAVADLAPHSRLTADQQQQLAAALLARTISTDAASGESLRRQLLESVLDDLGASAARGAEPGEASQVFDSAAELLAETYRQRARNYGVSGPEFQVANSPAQALELSLRPLAESLRGSAEDAAYLANLGHVHKAAVFLAGDDLRRTVAGQRILVEISARRAVRHRPQEAAAARQIETESLAAISKTDNVLAQLRDQEATLLKLWMLYAPEV